MKILFDQGTPFPLRKYLTKHVVSTAYKQGWSEFENGDLLRVAEQNGFELFVTTDQNLRYQQNLNERELAIVVLLSTSWPKIKLEAERIAKIIDNAQSGDYVEITI